MFGPAEDCCRVCLQQRSLESPSDSTTQNLAVAFNAFAIAFKLKSRGTVLYQVPAC